MADKFGHHIYFDIHARLAGYTSYFFALDLEPWTLNHLLLAFQYKYDFEGHAEFNDLTVFHPGALFFDAKAGYTAERFRRASETYDNGIFKAFRRTCDDLRYACYSAVRLHITLPIVFIKVIRVIPSVSTAFSFEGIVKREWRIPVPRYLL